MSIPKVTDDPEVWEWLRGIPVKQQLHVIVMVVSRLYEVPYSDIMGRTREQPTARARQHAMYLLHTKANQRDFLTCDHPGS